MTDQHPPAPQGRPPEGPDAGWGGPPAAPAGEPGTRPADPWAVPAQHAPGGQGAAGGPGRPDAQGQPGQPGAAAWQGDAAGGPVGVTAGHEVLSGPGGAVPAPRSGGRRGLVVGLSAGAAALAIAGGAYAWSLVGGGGEQPEDHLPASVAAVMKVDLDPSIGQKVDAVRFFAKFPLGESLRGGDDTDLRQWVYEQLTKDGGDAPPWSQVEPWLGDRAAIAVAPAADDPAKPVPLLALEVTDEAKARSGLAALADTDTGFVVSDGWAIVSDTTAHAQAAADAARTKPLAQDARFAEDTGRLGTAGIVRAWMDGERLKPLLQAAMPDAGAGSAAALGNASALTSQLKGHGAVSLRFSGPALELVGRYWGDEAAASALASGGSSGIERLPDGSLAGVGVAGAGDALSQQWKTALAQLGGVSGTDTDEAVREIEQQTGLRLPDDLRTLFGERLLLAVGGPDAAGDPQVGARVASTSPDLSGALARLDAFLEESDAPVTRRDVDGGYVMATSQDQAAAMTRDGTLGQTARFKDAVPNAASAPVAVYADIAGLVDAYAGSLSADDRADFEPLAAFGMTAAPEDGGFGFTMRVTTR